jgi:aconitase B
VIREKQHTMIGERLLNAPTGATKSNRMMLAVITRRQNMFISWNNQGTLVATRMVAPVTRNTVERMGSAPAAVHVGTLHTQATLVRDTLRDYT